MSLSPWDLSADISFDFSLYRPRRASYVYATRVSRGQRNESYRHATKHSSTTSAAAPATPGGASNNDVFGDDNQTDKKLSGPLARKKRAESYRAAIKRSTNVPPADGVDVPSVCAASSGTAERDGKASKSATLDLLEDIEDKNPKWKQRRRSASINDGENVEANRTGNGSPDDAFSDTTANDSPIGPVVSAGRCIKNLVVLSVSFVLIFTAFGALQNLTTSLHGPRMGSISLACVHGAALVTGLFAPAFVQRIGPRWSVALGAIGYPLWIAANFCSLNGGASCGLHFAHGVSAFPTLNWETAGFMVVLVIASLVVGVGQSVAWCSQVAYVRNLARAWDSSAVNNARQRKARHPPRRSSMTSVFRCNGFFLACFQTVHVWGNLASSVLLSAFATSASSCNAAATGNGDSGDNSPFGMNDVIASFSDRMYHIAVGYSGNDNGGSNCGTYDTVCFLPEMDGRSDVRVSSNTSGFICRLISDPVASLMIAYVTSSVAGLVLLVLLLDNIRFRSSTDRSLERHLPSTGEPTPTSGNESSANSPSYLSVWVCDCLPRRWCSKKYIRPSSDGSILLVHGRLGQASKQATSMLSENQLYHLIPIIFLKLIGTLASENWVWKTVAANIRHVASSRIYSCLLPLMLFNGFEKAFVYGVYNKSYVGCTVGTSYVGYCMMTIGVTNAVCSCLIGCAVRHVPREALVGIGCVLHAALVVFLLVWIPDRNLVPVFFVVSALWGVCGAIWQTQTNGLVNQCCSSPAVSSASAKTDDEPEIDTDFAFQIVRFSQSIGATTSFILGAIWCDVSIQLYGLVALLSMAVLGYVVVEYRLRKRAAVAAAASASSSCGTPAGVLVPTSIGEKGYSNNKT